MPPVTCCHLARSQCRPDRRELLEKATYYEDLATETLRCVRSSAVAYALLSVIPWELCSAPKKGDGEPDKHVVPLWASSVLDEASTADGLRSFPCRHFIGHRHSQETLGRYFAGNYPESKAQIAPGSSLIAILMQCLMPFLPGTIVEVSPVSLPHEHVLSGPSVTEKFKDLEADNEVGADEQQALQEMREALSIGEDEEREKAMKLKEAGLLSFLDDEVTDLREDLKSFRFLAFYNIPKVKFVLDFFFYIIYVVQNTFIAIRLRQVDPNCVNALNMSCTNEDAGYTTASPISVNEVIFWVWCGAKMLNELDNIKSFDKVGLAEYIGDTWNQQDVLFFIITAVIIPLRLWFNIHTEPPEPDVAGAPMHTLTALPVDLYSILLVLNYFRILRYLSYYKSVGVLVLVVNYMMVDVAVFSTLLFLITIGFGFAFFTLLPTRVSDAPGIGFFLGSHPVFDSWWGMFGDYDRGSMYRDLGTQMPTAIIAPTMLFLYEFFSVVLLMNLLVALMSDTYARVTAEGELNWQYARAGLIREYLTQSPLPAPFNVLYYVFYRIPMNLYRWHRKNSVGEKLLEAGFKYLPTQRMLASLRKAEQEAVRKLLDQREKEEALEATAMIEAMSARLEKMQRDSTTKFEAMNQRFDELLRKVEDSSTKSVTKHDLSWAAPLDKVWHAPPAFTKADEQKLVTFSPVTWALMRELKHAEAVSRNMEDVGGTGTPLVQWDERFGCRVALSMVTLSDVRRGGVEETRLVCWQGEWSKDGKGGTFAKVFDPSKGARDSDDADAMMQSIVTSADALPDEPLVIERVEEDAVMKIVTLSVQRATPISGRFSFVLENPERFPLNEDMLKLKPEVVVAAGAAVAPPTSTPSALRMPIKHPPGQAPGQAPGQDPMAA
jgi:preprotein translocase subunit Sec61beta